MALHEKKSLSSLRPPIAAGPLLADLVAVQRANEEALEFPQLEGLSRSLIARARELRSPLIWPVGEPANRFAGAAVMVACGDLRVRGWTDSLEGERVLLLAIAEASQLTLVEAAARARTLGAVEVHAAFVQVGDLAAGAVFDSQVALRRATAEPLLAAV